MKQLLLCLLFALPMLSAIAQRDCRQLPYQEIQLATSPQLNKAYNQIEAFTKTHLYSIQQQENISKNNNSSVPAVVNIPVVVHVLWNTSAQNISDAQIASQIDVLNKDYNGLNDDRNQVPVYFADLIGNCGFHFELARVDPLGNPCNGTIRKHSNIQAFGIYDAMKAASTGGDDPWDASSYLNIWVCNMETGMLGYSSSPGSPKAIDGVVISTNVFGTIGIAGPFNKGRTATHEIGHWLNLRHIWGDAACGSDLVDDTPTQEKPTRGCASGEVFSCNNSAHGNMYMNFMDFTDDGCMHMFTIGQKQRMRALFEPGGPRAAILNSQALNGPGLPNPVSTVGTDKSAAATLMVYPNPASNFIQLQFLQKSDVSSMELFIYNLQGQLVKKEIWRSNTQAIAIDKLGAGIYYIKISGKYSIVKFMKQ
jgi:hypothetical protein